MTVAVHDAKPKRYVLKQAGKVIGRGELRVVPINVIRLDRSYQRDTNSHWVQQHLPFDPQKAGAIVLSSRMGGPWCIEGGHRVELARASGVSSINAFVIDGLSKADEARLFVMYQRERRNLTSWDLWRAMLESGDEEAMALNRIVNNAGFRISKTAHGPDNITAVDSLRYIQRYGGDDLVSRTLGLIRDIWLGEDKAVSGPNLKGLALFLHSSGQQPSFQRERLVRVMQTFAPMKVGRLAQAIADKRNATTAGPANFAEALLAEYNKMLPKGEQPLGPLMISNKRRPAPRGA